MRLRIAADLIREADAILLTSGAGMGVPSNLGTYRGNSSRHNWQPMIKHNISFTHLSNPVWFLKKAGKNVPTSENAGFAYAFWQHRYHMYTRGSRAGLHEGYDIISKWFQKKIQANKVEKGRGGFCVTSDIDGAWLRCPGIDGERVYECHGSIEYMQCVRGCRGSRIHRADPANDWSMDIDEETDCAMESSFPCCEVCGGRKRPNVLMFDDDYFDWMRCSEQRSRFSSWIQSVKGENINRSAIGEIDKDFQIVVVEIGAGIGVQTIRRISESVVRSIGLERCSLIRINPEHPSIDLQTSFDPRLSHRLLSFAGDSLDVIKAIDELL